jgi:DNA-binding SARP family transcriptional activator
MALEIGLLGPVLVVMDGRPVALPAPRRRVVLAALALAAGRTVSTAGLARYLWGEDIPELARRGLTTIVTRLRRDLGRDVIVSAANGYALTKPAPVLDVHRFHGLLSAARAADPETEVDLLERALACWRGEPLQDVGSETLVAEYAPGLIEEWYATTERRIDLLLAANLHADLVVELRDLTAQQPLRESLWCRLIVTLYRSGRPAEALEAYQVVRELLADRLGVGPGPELMAIHRAVLRHDPAVAAPAMVDRLERPRLTRVLGPVGSFAGRGPRSW